MKKGASVQKLLPLSDQTEVKARPYFYIFYSKLHLSTIQSCLAADLIK